jgi:hypothetical protein
MKDLEITHYYEGISNKLEVLSELTAMLGIELSEVAFVGDDALDLPALESVGLAVTPPDAHPLARAKAHYETMAAGGAGAVREVADLVLHAAGRLERAVHALSNNTLAGAFGVIIPARYASSRLPGMSDFAISRGSGPASRPVPAMKPVHAVVVQMVAYITE